MKKYITQSLSLAFMLLTSSLAFAHGTSLKIDKTAAAPGESIIVKGEGIGSNAAISLTLRGMRQDYSLGDAQGNEHGVFEKQVAIPGDVQPGTYTLVAAAGNAEATARLMVSESAAQESTSQEDAASGDPEKHPAGQPGHGDKTMTGSEMAGNKEMSGQEAKAEPMEIDRSATTAEKLVAWAMVLFSGVLGVGLLIREKRLGRRASEEERL